MWYNTVMVTEKEYQEIRRQIFSEMGKKGGKVSGARNAKKKGFLAKISREYWQTKKLSKNDSHDKK